MRLTLLFAITTLAGCPSGIPTDTGVDPNDRDGDGTPTLQDCDDNNPDVYPGADDSVGDSVDNNCDGVDGVDEDGDTFASTESGGPDCDDANSAINPDGTEVGWNDVDEDCLAGDRHDWTLVATGQFVTCGVKSTGDFVCWGDDTHGEVSSAPTGTGVTYVDGAEGYLCAIQDGAVVCWGDDENGLVSGAPEGSNFVKVTTGNTGACALTNLGVAECWGDDEFGQVTSVPVAELDDVSVGLNHTCGVFDIGGPLNVTCWGDPIIDEDDGEVIPNGPFRTVVTGTNHACGILDDSTLKCWGQPTFGQTSPVNRTGPYTDLAAHGDTNCGILSASEITCWGRNNFGQLDAPDQSAIQVDVGYSHGCAINGQGIMFCWGDNLSGQGDIP